jgi:Tfp pilus assembly protein PilX
MTTDRNAGMAREVPRSTPNREGFALALVLVVVMIVAGVAAGASMMGSSSFAMTLQEERRGLMVSAADAGLEQARARINGNKALYPDSQFNMLENGVTVYDADSTAVPGLRRSTYVGPTGITTGQYGVFGSIVTIVEDANGDRVIRRLEILQESFAKYAYFTDIDFTANIWFGGGDQIFGPLHSNDSIAIHATGATFHKRVSTAKTVLYQANGTFLDVIVENAPRIPMPQTADLSKLRNYAIAGGTRIVGDTNGGVGEATTRIEFLAIDLDGDGLTNGVDEGFFRVYQSSTNANWVSGDISIGSPGSNYNCGDIDASHASPYQNKFMSAAQHSTFGSHDRDDALNSSSSRCMLGGMEEITGGTFYANTPGPFPSGSYRAWTGTVDPRLSSRPDKNYLWPLSRAINPNFKGVIFVDGKSIIHGDLRGRITLASPNDIILGDDVRYVTDPASATCEDILGLFSGQDVVIADNSINSPWDPGPGSTRTWDADSRDEFLHGVVLALSNFTVENYNSGSNDDEPCQTTDWGRGCLRLTGGVIQTQRGAVGTAAGYGYLKRYSYDACAASDPPPYFPTTGHFIANRYFDIDPTGFSVAALYASLTPPGI